MSLMFVLFVYVLISLFEGFSLYKKNQKKELIVFAIFLVAAFGISSALALGIKIPSHDIFIGRLIRSITGE